MVLNYLSHGWRPAVAAAAALLAGALLMASPAAPVSAQAAPAKQAYIVTLRPDAVEKPPKFGQRNVPNGSGAQFGPGGRELPRGAAARLASLHSG